MVLADTNLVIPLLIEHEQRENALDLFQRDPDWHLPDWWQIELTNVLRNYHRAELFSLEELLEIQRRACYLLPRANTHPVELQITLRIACESNISADDARFIALARTFGQKLVTEDSRLRRACPQDTLSLPDALAQAPWTG